MSKYAELNLSMLRHKLDYLVRVKPLVNNLYNEIHVEGFPLSLVLNLGGNFSYELKILNDHIDGSISYIKAEIEKEEKEYEQHLVSGHK